MDESEEIGKVFKFFAKPSVAAVIISAGELRIGDTIQIKGETTDFTQLVESMEIDRVPVESVRAGQDVGIKVKERVRPNDRLFRLESE